MKTEILWGKDLAQKVIQKIASQIGTLRAKVGRIPGLAVVLVGNDPPSQIYVSHKTRACERAGIRSLEYHLSPHTTMEEILHLIQRLNTQEEVDGILVQLPLPPHLNQSKILGSIDPNKDVDGFHPYNMGKLSLGEERITPCTPKGVMTLLDYYDIPVEGREVVVVGASNIVGKPLALMLVNRMATVTICHIMTKDPTIHTKKAEIIFTATGVPHLIKRGMVREGAIIVDIGISREQGKIVGDADFQGLQGWAGAITPVPGGVGPMTVAMLMENTLQAFRMRTGTQ